MLDWIKQLRGRGVFSSKSEKRTKQEVGAIKENLFYLISYPMGAKKNVPEENINKGEQLDCKAPKRHSPYIWFT